MEDGTFMTGVELLGNNVLSQVNRNEEKSQIPPVYKNHSGAKTARAPVTSRGTSHTRNESLPQIQTARESAPRGAMRHSMSETNFKKPLFKKLAAVRDIYDKTKIANEDNRAKTSRVNKGFYSSRSSKENNLDNKSFTHADAFNMKIIQKFDELYQNRKHLQQPANHYDPLTKRRHFFDELDKQEVRLQVDLKKFNYINYDIGRKEKILAGLTFQHEELDKHLEDTARLEVNKIEKQEQIEVWKERIEVEEHRNESLKHMKQLKKEFLMNIKKNYIKTKEEYDEYMASIDYLIRNAEYDKNLMLRNKTTAKELKKKGIKDNLIGPKFEVMLEEEISEFEERRNLREIFKHEKVIEEEIRKQEEEDLRRSQIERETRQKDEDGRRQQKEAEHTKELNKIKKQYYEFQRVTHVAKKEKLVEYFEGLEVRNCVLQKEIDSLDSDLKEGKEVLDDLKGQIKAKKFEETDVVGDQYPQDVRLDDLEILLRDRLNDLGEREKHNNRLEKLSYEVCTVVSRILKQLQKTKTPASIDKSNVVDMLSICGLKLERMLTVVIKKKKTFFIESINTDGTIKEGPPTYMNIVSDDLYNKSKRRYEKEEKGLNILDELDDDDLSTLRHQIKERDEFDSQE